MAIVYSVTGEPVMRTSNPEVMAQWTLWGWTVCFHG